MIKNWLLKPTLNKKLVAIMLFLNLGLIFILVFLYYQTEKMLYNEFERQTSELLKAIQIGLEQATSSGMVDEKSLQEYLRKLNAKGVKEISLISTSDRIISSTNPKDIGKWITKNRKELIIKAELGEPVTGKGQVYSVMIPVVLNEKNMGYIYLTINTEDFSVFLRTSVIRRIIAASVIFVIGTILAVFLAKRYTKPIEEVVSAAQSVAAGDLNHELHTKRKDEIGELARSFNYMIGKLKEERVLKERLWKAEHMAGIGLLSQSIAHEIKNPLNFISLSIDHIKEAYKLGDIKQSEKLDSLLLNMKNEVLRVSKFSESFLELGKPLELNRQKTDMGRLIGDVIELVSSKAQKDNININAELNVQLELDVDPEFIKTCLYNIIINSFQAMPDGGNLSIVTKIINQSFSISIEDTGAGVPESRRGKVFDPFYTTKANGLGIGLAFTKKVIEEHSGKVAFQSIEGKGSTVTLTLPLPVGRV
jgi:nitrogen fixation/metabolism regulation signal transduction histidine kinase